MKALKISVISIIFYIAAWVIFFITLIMSGNNLPLIIGVILAIISLVLSIIAMTLGKKALNINPGDKNAKAGRIIGIVFFVLSIIEVVVVLGFFIVNLILISTFLSSLSGLS